MAVRVALGIEYNGSRYYGWQRQSEADSVQERLELALSRVANSPIQVVCAGRTDAGVHATNQVVHFDSPHVRPARAWTMGVNTHLPDNIAVRWCTEVANDFSARFSARARRYRYVIVNTPLRPGILSAGVTHIYFPLDAKKMHLAAQALLGEHDFTSFRASQCQSHTPFRNVHEVTVKRKGEYVVVDIKANAFVHHMVRNIVGSLLSIGSEDKPVEWIDELLKVKDRTQAAATAKPNGLYLVEVEYPEQFKIPGAVKGPLFLPQSLAETKTS